MNAVDRVWMRGIWLPLGQVILPLAGVVCSAGIASAQIAGPVTVPLPGNVSAVREIDDRSLGTHWLLVRDPGLPQAPGHLLCTKSAESDERTLSQWGRPAVHSLAISHPLRSVIRSGESLIIEDDTGIATARLEAVALGPAAVGSVFEARLKIGGTRLKVLALAPGRAKLLPQIGVQP